MEAPHLERPTFITGIRLELHILSRRSVSVSAHEGREGGLTDSEFAPWRQYRASEERVRAKKSIWKGALV